MPDASRLLEQIALWHVGSATRRNAFFQSKTALRGQSVVQPAIVSDFIHRVGFVLVIVQPEIHSGTSGTTSAAQPEQHLLIHALLYFCRSSNSGFAVGRAALIDVRHS